MFELAIDLRNRGELRDAVAMLSKIVDDYSNDERIAGIHGLLAGIYMDLKEHEKALENFRKATILSPKSELASLGLYLSYVNADRDEEAIGELIRYLKKYPADLYKVTLEELLEDLKNGYMTDYEREIKDLAKINGVELS